MRLVIVGDVLLDREVRGRVERLCPDSPVPIVEDVVEGFRPGGAGLAATMAADDGAAVTLVTALAEDAPAEKLRDLLHTAGVEVVDIGLDGTTPQKVRIGSADRCLLRVDLGYGGTVGYADPEDLLALVERADAVLVSDYGHGVAAADPARAALERSVADTPVVWDPHPRGPHPVPGVRLATPNASEVSKSTGGGGGGIPDLARWSATLRRRWRSAALCTTMGSAGALMVDGSPTPLVVPPPFVASGDPCGAGDRFAVSAARSLGSGSLVSEAVRTAVAESSAFVANGGPPAAPPTTPSYKDAFAAAAGVRESGGRVVATGGCFDLIHAGHIALLKAAARLGDRLIVCINSDESVRRLKGPDRPFVSQADRAEVLLSIAGVDHVVGFDEDTPASVLERIRPHVFVKGGDYAGTDIPESEVLERWGGRAVVLPYLDGRSTTAIAEEVVKRAQR
jgi:D-beta-D-heptose 7-phosphate kinase / D-beta-D-heptose 1-phosphate adenosyltransferase